MSTAILRPNGDGYYADLVTNPLFVNHYENVDEITPNDDTDYNYLLGFQGGPTGRDSYTLESWSPGAVTISSVTVHLVVKRSATVYTVRPSLRLNSTDSDGSDIAPTTSYAEYSQQVSRPGGGNWTIDDINNLEVGLYIPNNGTPGRFEYIRITQVWVVVTYTEAGNYPAPTSLECERESQPTNASESPVFTAIFNGDAPTDVAAEAYIEVSEESDFSATIWDSGWLNITDVDDGDRCELITYAGSTLSSSPPNGWYYWRIKFKDASAKESVWSSASTFKGVNRAWADSSFASRWKLLLDPDHPAITGGADPEAYTFSFEFQTGLRKAIADNGCFNEAIQSSGGFQVEYYQGRWHVVYLSTTEDDTNAQYAIYAITLDAVTGTVGTPAKIANSGTAFDTHYFPTFLIPQSGAYAGYLHVVYGCHGSPVAYARSKNPNESGSLPGDASPAWNTGMSIGSDCSYAIGLHVPSADRLFIFVRRATDLKYAFYYTENNGQSWSGPYHYAENAGADKKRLYQYGFRFDRSRERLHIAFSPTDYPTQETSMGAWYAYCDYDSGQSEGFHEWKKANGSTCGTTDSSLINRTTADKILDTDDENLYFAKELILTRTLEPRVVITHQHRSDSAQDPAAIIVARYDSGWQLSHVSDQTNYEVRVARCGIPGLADRDDTLHLFTCVGGRAYKHALPDGTGYYSDWDQYPATGDPYDKIDDGIHQCDADETYISASTVGNKATFTSSYELPANCTPLGVNIEILSAVPPGNYGIYIRPLIRIGGTDYYGDSWSIWSSKYDRFSFTWPANPATSAAWTKSEVEALEFGVELYSGTGSCRVTRITKRILAMTALDEEFWSGEIVECLSSDGGDTWTAREITENSGIGVPILNSSHHLMNDQLVMVWTSGNQVFWFSDEPFGRMLRSGRDVAVYYAGSEIDRLIDYPNMLTSKIYFKCQEEIAAGRIAGPDDYYIYAGAAAGAARATKGNPDNVLAIHDSFEALAGGSNLDGQRGWTVNSGTVTIFDTGGYLNHTNKVYSGGQSVKMATGGANVEKDVGSALTNVLILVGIWMEGTGNYVGVRAVDTSDNIWEAGLDYSSAAPYYGTGSVSSPSRTTEESPRVRNKAYNRFGIQIGGSGCSAWANDVQFADEVAAITGIDKIQVLATGAECYFDSIWVMQRLTRRTTATVTQANITDKTMSYSTEHGSTYSGTSDAKHDAGSQGHIYAVDVKIRAKLLIDIIGGTATFDAHISTGSQYSGANHVSNQSGQIIDLVLNTWVEKTISFADLDVGQYSAKVDFYASNVSSPGTNVQAEILEVTYYYWEQDPVIEVQPEERRGIYIAMTILGGGRDQVTIRMAVNGYLLEVREQLAIDYRSQLEAREQLPLDSLASVAQSLRLAMEYLETATDSARLPMDNMTAVSQSEKFPIDYRGSLAIAERLPIESAQSIIVIQNLPLSFRGAFVSSLSAPVEFLRSVSKAALLPLEFGGAFKISEHLPLEWGRGILSGERLPIDIMAALAMGTALRLEYRARLVALQQLPAEWLELLLSPGGMPLEFGQGFTVPVRLPIESGAGVVASERIPVEWRGTEIFTVSNKLPVEWRGSLKISEPIPAEYLSGMRISGGRVPIEFCGRLVHNERLTLDWLTAQHWFQKFHIEFLQVVTAKSVGLVEWLQQRTASWGLPTEFRRAIAVAARLPVEWGGTMLFSVSQQLPIEWRTSISESGRLELEFLSARAIEAAMPVEFGHGFEISEKMPIDNLAIIADLVARLSIDWTRQLADRARMPLEYGMLTADSVRLLLESLAERVAFEGLPLEWRGTESFSQSFRMPVCWQATLAEQIQVPVEFRSTLEMISGRLLVDWGASLTVSHPLLVEFGQSIAIAEQLLADWMGTVDVRGKLAVEFRGHVVDSIRLNVEHGRGFVTETRVPIEWLRTLAAREQLPVEWMGVAITAICLLNATLKTPGLINATIGSAAIRDAIIKSAGLTGARLSTAAIDEAVIQTMGIINQLMKGGG